MEYSGADIVIRLLERQGIDLIAGIPGGTNLPLYDALGKSSIRHILARHEQGAGFIAQGMARSTGGPAVCFATSGPGATNLITAIADAHLDSVPVVAISGQTPLSLMGTDAFQEVDTYGMSLPITKHNFLVRSVEELLTVIPKAFEIALSGRPGPVWVDIPRDVQTATMPVSHWPEPGEKSAPTPPDEGPVTEAARMIAEAERPVFYAGGGITHSGAGEAVRMLCKKNGIPLVSTLMGLGILSPDSPGYLGMLGMHGSRATNMILDQADLLIAAGVRFDDRATGKIESFCPHARIIHMDIDRSEIDKICTTHCGISGDAGEILARLTPKVAENSRSRWQETIARIQKENPGPRFSEDPDRPEHLIRQVARYADKDSFIATDVGQHQMWTAQYYPFSRPGQFLTSGGLGTMGFGLPAALGAALKHPGRQVICFSGDGSIMMNLQELATLAENSLNVKIIVLNNGALGLVRQQQELFFEGRYTASRFSCNPDLVAIARGFGIPAITINPSDNGEETLKAFLSAKGPGLVNIPINPTANVFPMVPPGASNTQMIGGH